MNQIAPDDNAYIVSLLDEAYAIRINNLKKSIELSEKALELSVQINNMALIGRSLSELSLFAMIMGDYQNSMEKSRRAIEIFEALSDENGVAHAKFNIGSIYYKTDNFHLGLIYLIDCLSIYKKYDDFHNMAKVQKSLGTIYEYFGDQNNAIKSYETAIESARKAGDLNLESNVYNPLSGVYLKQNNPEKAREIIELSIEIKKSTNDLRGLAFALYGRGKVHTHTGNFEKAEVDFEESLKIHTDSGERLGLGMVYYKMAVLSFERRNLEEAKTRLKKGLEVSNTYNIVIMKVKSLFLFYKIYKQEGNHLKALEYLEKYLTQKESVINTQTLKIIENYELITKMESLEKEAISQREKAEIIEKKNLAEQAAKVKQDFLSTMSHEIRTPLNAVITITNLLSEKSEKEEKQLLDSLKFASNNLLLIINDILDFTKLDMGKVSLEEHSVDISKLLNNIKFTYENLAKEKGLELNLFVDKGISGHYMIDQTKLSQILANLITNAIKYTETGKVEVKVQLIGFLKDSHQIRFSVIDTGLGIQEENLDSIFESFSQPKFITTRKQGGSGLGLAIVKKLVELHDSNIRLVTHPSFGSTFYFDLILTPSEIKETITPNISKLLRNKTVLLAEDNLINAMVAIKLLKNWELITDHAKNGLEAIEKAKAKKYDFILMDIHMPEMDGFEAAQIIRTHENLNQSIPIFALTADITAKLQEEYIGYFNGFLTKPIEVDKLYEALCRN